MPRKITPEDLREWGIVGAGGAGFPTEVKCRAKAQLVIVNAAECEPLLHKDKELLKAYPADLFAGLIAVMKMTGAKEAAIAIKGKYTDVIELLRSHLPKNVRIYALGDFYPAGDEFMLVHAVTGRVIPPAGLPLDVGCIVNNVETLINVGRACPVVAKYLTVAGAVKNPVSICVPVGISIRECIELAGGANVADPVVLVGGAMMGTFCEDLDLPVTKMTGGLIVLSRQHVLIQRYTRTPKQVKRIALSACDQCSDCTELCPRYLLGHPIQPHKAMRAVGFAQPAAAIVIGTLFCCECNLCTLWSCPEGLDPRAVCVETRQHVRESGEKWQQQEVKPHPLIEERRTPMARLMKRLGLSGFTNKGPLQDGVAETGRVVLPLKQHVGVPAESIVRVGDTVRVGDKVAAPPDGKLGASIHASIDGSIVSIDGAIVIEKNK